MLNESGVEHVALDHARRLVTLGDPGRITDDQRDEMAASASRTIRDPIIPPPPITAILTVVCITPAHDAEDDLLCGVGAIRAGSSMMVPEAPLEQTEHGLTPGGDGWFVVNARETRWRSAEGRGAITDFEGEHEFQQLGIHLFVLGPGEPMSMYHWEADQEDFLVLSGEAVLIVEGEERPLRQWDFVHCPPGTKHTIVGAGDGPCLVLGTGARDRTAGPDWGGYTVDEAALRHSAGVEHETTDQREAYAHVGRRVHVRYPDGWLPD